MDSTFIQVNNYALHESTLSLSFTIECSNLAYGLLGHCLVEHLFPGMTYEEYVMKNIIQPLNLTNTGFNITDR